MGAADRLAEELKAERDAEQRRTVRRDTPTLIYKTHIQEPPLPPAPTAGWINQRITGQISILHQAVAEFVCTREYAERERRQDAEAKLNESLGRLQDEVALLREQAERERRLNKQAAETDRAERESVRQELVALREQLALERSLRDLRSEVAEAQKQIPKVPALVTQIQTEARSAQTDANRKIAALQRELRGAKDKIGDLLVQASQLEYGVKQLEHSKPRPGIELKFETSASTFTMKDVHPDAQAAWQRFVADVLDTPQDATMLLTDPAAGNA